MQNGVLKSLSFLFEYIGEMGKDYIYAVTPLLEDALMDRDLVHRQTAASVVQHMALGVAGTPSATGSPLFLRLSCRELFPAVGSLCHTCEQCLYQLQWCLGCAAECFLLRLSDLCSDATAPSFRRAGVRGCADAPAQPRVAQYL